MNVRLIHLDPCNSNDEILLTEFPAILGRGAESALRLTDRWASRRHCRLDQLDGRLVVRDLGSRHGTLVNGQKVDQSPLMPGDRLTVGISNFRVVYESPVADPSAAVEANA